MGNKLVFTDVNADDTGLLPDFCDVRIIFMLILLVELLAVVLASTPSVAGFWDQFAFVSMLMLWIGLINAAVLCSTRRWLNSLSNKSNIALSFGIMMLVSLCICLFTIGLKSWLALDDVTSPLGEHFLLRILVMSAAIYAVVLRYFYVQQQWKLYLLAHARAEIQALRARMRPHFLFNSMNTIASLISFKPDKAEKAIEDLADLFRASLHEKDTNTLEDELGLTRSYLDIEDLRLGKRLKVEWDIDSSLKDTEIPSLCLQPLVENAIYHGIEPLPEGGVIRVTARRDGQHLLLEVCNPRSHLMQSTHKGNRIAQENIQQRLHLVYGNEAAFKIKESGSDYSVSLRIPLGASQAA